MRKKSPEVVLLASFEAPRCAWLSPEDTSKLVEMALTREFPSARLSVEGPDAKGYFAYLVQVEIEREEDDERMSFAVSNLLDRTAAVCGWGFTPVYLSMHGHGCPGITVLRDRWKETRTIVDRSVADAVEELLSADERPVAKA